MSDINNNLGESMLNSSTDNIKEFYKKILYSSSSSSEFEGYESSPEEKSSLNREQNFNLIKEAELSISSVHTSDLSSYDDELSEDDSIFFLTGGLKKKLSLKEAQELLEKRLALSQEKKMIINEDKTAEKLCCKQQKRIQQRSSSLSLTGFDAARAVEHFNPSSIIAPLSLSARKAHFEKSPIRVKKPIRKYNSQENKGPWSHHKHTCDDDDIDDAKACGMPTPDSRVISRTSVDLENLKTSLATPSPRTSTGVKAEMLKIVNEAMKDDKDPVEILCARLSIMRRDVKTLSPSTWLNDNVINGYFRLIQEQFKKRVYSFSTFFFNSLKRSSSRAKRYIKNDDIFSFQINLVPLHLKVHWSLIVINHREKTIIFYDSLLVRENALEEARESLDMIHQFITNQLEEKTQNFDPSVYSTEIAENIPQQKNGFDCGVFILKFAEYVCRDAEINFTQENIEDFRKLVAFELVTGQLLERSFCGDDSYLDCAKTDAKVKSSSNRNFI